MCTSIGGPVFFADPLLKHVLSRIYVDVFCRDRSIGVHAVDLLVYEGVIKTNFGGIVARVGVIDGVGPGPINGSEAHGAGFAACIEDATIKLMGLQVGTCITYCLHLGMCRGIVCGNHPIESSTYDFAVFDDHAAKGATICLI